MARRRAIGRRDVTPDPVFGSKLVTRFINRMMRDGKKRKASGIFYEALKLASEELKRPDQLQLFEDLIDRIKPTVEVKSRRVGGTTYPVPFEVRPERGITLAIRWVISAARSRSGERTMVKRLAAEIVDVMNGRGGSTKMLENVKNMAAANQAFAHYSY